MDNTINLVIYDGETHTILAERLKFVLSELGISVTLTEEHSECGVYSLSHIERDNGEEEETDRY